MDNLASIFIEKTILGTNLEILQIASVFKQDSKFRYYFKYIKNNIKNSNNAVSLPEAIIGLNKLIKDKNLILKNDDNNDFKILNNIYNLTLKQPLTNMCYDIAKNAAFLGYKKTNLNFLCNLYNINIKNDKQLPTSVFKAQKLYLIGVKMFNLG